MRVLIIRLSSIGDVLRVMPAVQAIRDAYPRATVDWAVSESSADLVADFPAVDNVLVWRKPQHQIAIPGACAKYLWRINRGRYDVALDFHGMNILHGLAVAASRAKTRGGFPKWRTREFCHLFSNRKAVLSSKLLNRVDEFIELARLVAPNAVVRRPMLPVSPSHHDETERFWLEHCEMGKPTVLVHAPVEALQKRWPPERFAAVADQLIRENLANVILTCGPHQEAQLRAVVRSMKVHEVPCQAFSSLKSLIEFVRRADVVIANDTGPMHIASAIGTPVVALFPSRNVVYHRPYWPPATVLYRPLHGRHGHTGTTTRCSSDIDWIGTEDVFGACKELLQPHLGAPA